MKKNCVSYPFSTLQRYGSFRYLIVNALLMFSMRCFKIYCNFRAKLRRFSEIQVKIFHEGDEGVVVCMSFIFNDDRGVDAGGVQAGKF